MKGTLPRMISLLHRQSRRGLTTLCKNGKGLLPPTSRVFRYCANANYSSQSHAHSQPQKKSESRVPVPSAAPISEDLIHHLERTSLVDFDSAEAVERLSEAIAFANQLFEVNTEGVEPLVFVLENESLYLRDDVAEPTKRNHIIKNASVTEEDYFVAPPGNIPLEKSSKEFI